MGKDYFPCYNSYLEKTAKLSDQELGRLFRALMTYSATGEPAQLAGREALAYDFIVYDIDKDREHYQEVSDARSKARTGAGKKEPVQDAADQKKQKRQKKSKTTNDDKSNQTDHLLSIDINCAENKDKDAILPSAEGQMNPDHLCISNLNPPALYQPNCNNNTISSELPASRASEPAAAVISLPLNDGSMRGITQDEIDHWADLYPAVDVLQELRKMVGWLEANPKKRKTPDGVKRFINTWLSRTQDRGGSNGFSPGGGGSYGGYSRQSSEPQPFEWSGGALADFA